MINIAFFAFFTGLHLALLQFSYFFLLLTNVTSTYITYASVVLSWMTGTLIGLLWRRVAALPSLVVGVVSYYLTYWLVVSTPLSPFTLPIACAGVVVTGLWAGHFFVAMLGRFGRVDRLFLHENNGFLVGIVAVFVGFTLLGMGFLLWTPLISGVGLLAHMRWLQAHAPTVPTDAGFRHPELPAVEAHGTETGIATALASRVRGFGRMMVCVNVGLAIGLWLYALVTVEPYWRMFRGDFNAVAWFSSAQMLLIAAVSYLNYLAATLLPHHSTPRYPWIWIVLGMGFVVLALDERFEFHEALRDGIFEPAGLFVDQGWLIPGDVGLYLFLLVGLCFTPFILDELRQEPRSRMLFWLGIVLAAMTIVIDSLDDSALDRWPAPLFWDYTFEELGEVWAQLLILISFLMVLERRLKSTAVATAPALE